MRYILAIDQSTQGTKALLLDENGIRLGRKDIPHRQIITQNGWVSHDPEEIYHNTLQCAENLIRDLQIDAKQITCIGISNQRETSVAWDKRSGKPICDAIVWQCSRAKDIAAQLEQDRWGTEVKNRTGIPISPYFPAAKWAWMIQNVPGAREKCKNHRLCFGTVDTWLIYCLTKGQAYRTDFSNASRTQLFHLEKLRWDSELCSAFGLDAADLAEVCDSDSVFGMTDLGGVLPGVVPICGVAGDSHAALFGQAGIRPGAVKATYGTGSSVMMNVGDKPIYSQHGLVTSLAWKVQGKVSYVMEGNINYTGAVIAWMNHLGLIENAKQTQILAEQADPQDQTYLVPAFSGLGAPYWDSEAKAAFVGMTRLTGKAELVKAGLESIAYQIADIVLTMEQDSGIEIKQLRVDGGPTRNPYLMQFQSNILNRPVIVPGVEELSALGAAYLAGSAQGLLDLPEIWEQMKQSMYCPTMSDTQRHKSYAGWKDAVARVESST